MLIYNQGIEHIFFDLDHISRDYFQKSDYFVPFNNYLQHTQFYALYSQEEIWDIFTDGLNGEFLSYIQPIKYRFPKSIFSVIKELEVNALQSLLVTGNLDNIYSAHTFHLNSMYFRNKDVRAERTKLPDCVVDSVSDLEGYLNGRSDGYLNENKACDSEINSGKIYLENLYHPLDNGISSKLYTAGRYFTSADPRSYLHPLTGKILNFKEGDKVNIGKNLAGIVKINLDYISKKAGRINFITSVPAKPGKTDRIKLILENDEVANYASEIDCDILSVLRDYKPQKEAKGWDKRAENVNGVFSTNKKVSGHVVLVDDIITSGSTAMECVKMLLKAGAEKVSILALAAMQTKINTRSKLLIPCQCCDGLYKLRFNGNDARPFWGCSNFSSSNCRSSLEFYEGCNNLTMEEETPIFEREDVDLF
ncbi:ComF family protein [Bacillus sp. PK3_68]|uniref:ComF family protein n=1 Tax=Bacillus sp. PK3_68 TaxID=2027408 RepID=UPI000E76D215|nr:ComF family protein [Bacillus sp. PK3_68]RJS59180.1 hypothetical protein CJ483_03115 [Bacillus sp. PK3_68]